MVGIEFMVFSGGLSLFGGLCFLSDKVSLKTNIKRAAAALLFAFVIAFFTKWMLFVPIT